MCEKGWRGWISESGVVVLQMSEVEQKNSMKWSPGCDRGGRRTEKPSLKRRVIRIQNDAEIGQGKETWREMLQSSTMEAESLEGGGGMR